MHCKQTCAAARRWLVAGVWAGLFAALFWTAAAQAGPVCGPGPHWVDTCPAGTHTFNVQGIIALDTKIDGNLDGSADLFDVLNGSITLSLSGPLDESVKFGGTGSNDGHPDVIDIEIVALQLTSVSVNLGPLSVSPPPSEGVIVEDPGNPSFADSFFDVFVEIQLLPFPGITAENLTALMMESHLGNLATNIIYARPPNAPPLPLWNINNNALMEAQLVDFTLHFIPAPGALALFAPWLLIGLMVRHRVRWRRRSASSS